jgi:menaquinone-dependent protoporphyrinogen IX oxidase
MKALVIYESVYGNTRLIAEAIAQGLDDAVALPVHDAADRVDEPDLIVVGGPTHMHSLATTRSRQMAVEAVKEDGAVDVDPNAAKAPGLRAWLRDLPPRTGGQAAAFDTRLDRSPWVTGVASRGIAKRLRKRGYEVLSAESFLVEDSEGPLAEGELDRAHKWGKELAARVDQATSSAQT